MKVFFAALALLFAVTAFAQPAQQAQSAPQVALREALIWGILVGAGVHTARMLATRATMHRQSQSNDSV